MKTSIYLLVFVFSQFMLVNNKAEEVALDETEVVRFNKSEMQIMGSCPGSSENFELILIDPFNNPIDPSTASTGVPYTLKINMYGSSCTDNPAYQVIASMATSLSMGTSISASPCGDVDITNFQITSTNWFIMIAPEIDDVPCYADYQEMGS